jgi:CheY-like chemotaxis protein
MGRTTVLKGRSILVVEDDALIRLELTSLFESASAQVVATSTCEQAVIAIEQNQIRAAHLGHALREDKIVLLCRLLADCQIPRSSGASYLAAATEHEYRRRARTRGIQPRAHQPLHVHSRPAAPATGRNH